MTLLELVTIVALPLFAGCVAASAATVLRTLMVDVGMVRQVLELRPWNCNLCLSFWACLLVSVVFSWLVGPWAITALAGVAPGMALLRWTVGGTPKVTSVPLPLPDGLSDGLEQVK